MKEKVLIIEDDKDIVKMLDYNIKNEGFKTLSVRNGENAIDSAGWWCEFIWVCWE